MKRVMYGNELREALMRGVDLIANAVKSTLGPRGRNVIIGQRQFGKSPRITKDGVTVANWIDANDPAEQIGSDLMREASQKTMETVGDGTTTSMVLAQAMCRMGFEAVRNGAAPFPLRRGMERAAEAIIAEIHKRSITIENGQIEQIARLAANGDNDIALLVSDAIGKIGKDGVLTIEESQNSHSGVELVPGLQIASGYLSQAFVTNFETLKCEYDNPALLLWEGKITSARALGHVLSQAAQANIPLVVIAGDFEQEAIALLVRNRYPPNLFQSVAVKWPMYGDRRRQVMADIAALTDGQLFTEDFGAKLDNVSLSQLARPKKVIIDSGKTILINNDVQTLASGARIGEIRRAMEKCSTEDKPYLQARLAGLTGGVAVIKVGAVTETQMKEKKDRVEDAMYATKAAVDSGIVPGGGIALLRLSQRCWDLSWNADAGERVGIDIVRLACQVPCKQIAVNAGLNGDWITHQAKALEQAGSGFNYGYNAASGEWVDLVAEGVVDPAKVVIECLRNSVAVAGNLICTDAAVMDLEEKHAQNG